MDPTQRFSTRVADYRKYRPGYPAQIISDLTAAGALRPNTVVADIGSGTGLLTRLFLHNGNAVFGIEPNDAMRAAGEQELRNSPRFTSIAATAESTTLPDHSVNLIVAGQAFHWFDRPRAKTEFHRILRPPPAPRFCALIWNDRLTDATPFLRAYEQLLARYATDYATIDHRQLTPEILADFFHPHVPQLRTYPNEQIFDLPQLQGRLLSSSYTPPPGHPSHAPMLAHLAAIFHQHQHQGKVRFDYQTQMHLAPF